MRTVTKSQLEERVHIVMDVIKEVTGDHNVPESLKAKLNAMSFEDLGTLVVEVVKTRKINQILK